ncbi:hypothetical protein LZ30DRAFT_375825 [Colletotrichum cereale]|nr:hypothetical protein LZ30DRAFT_375825 [Colletotrichum cereale]
MHSIRTIASLALALGVAAIPAPAPERESVPVLDEGLSAISLDLDGLSLPLDLSLQNFPSVTAPSKPPTETPALSDFVSSVPPTSLDTLFSGTPSTLSTLAPAPSPIITCATILCRSPYVCRELEGRPGCYEKDPCGKVFCPYGTSCCNAGCSVCTPPDVMCTQEICGPDPIEAPVEDATLQ